MRNATVYQDLVKRSRAKASDCCVDPSRFMGSTAWTASELVISEAQEHAGLST